MSERAARLVVAERERERKRVQETPREHIETQPVTSGRRPTRGLRFVAGVAVSAIFLIPLVWMVTASLRPLGLPMPSTIQWWPEQATLDNYPEIFRILPLARYAFNSVLVVALAVPLSMLVASWAGFAMAQLPRRARDLLVALLVAALMVPLMSVWLSRFLIYKWLGILDTLGVLIVPALLGSSPFYVLIMFWAFRRVPYEQIEAARLDGASALRVWWSVGIPQVRPALMAVAVLSFERHWSNFIDPLLYITNRDWYTLPIALQALQQLHRSDWPLMMAGAVVVTLPAVLVFILAQRYFLREYDEGPGL